MSRRRTRPHVVAGLDPQNDGGVDGAVDQAAGEFGQPLAVSTGVATQQDQRLIGTDGGVRADLGVSGEHPHGLSGDDPTVRGTLELFLDGIGATHGTAPSLSSSVAQV